MRVPLSLLRSFCDPGLEPEAIASALALSGTEVERVRPIGVTSIENFLIGRVVGVEPHPDADRLRVCSVDLGGGEPSSIVCGAPNVATGQLVVVAVPGAVMPDGTKIKRAKLRGVESNGMICAEDELGLGEGHEGILVLADECASPGQRADSVLPLGETVLDLEITPNRPDCLGVYGVARELHAVTGAPLAAAPWQQDLGSAGELSAASVSVEVGERCPRFTARVYEGIGAAETPIEVRAHLHAAGMRSISPVVDITNYVMLVIGEPLHAFDLDRLEGSLLTVRAAAAGEQVATLDGQVRDLAEGELVICDDAGPTSIAGVMGGERSEVSDGTTRVLLEAAVWDGPSINATSARLGLRSEASGRFEKGVAPVQAVRAQAYASVLFNRFFGVDPLPGTIDIQNGSQAPAPIDLSHDRVRSLIGGDIDPARVAVSLERLGFELSERDGGVTALPPADRLDVEREVDLIEEVARIDGVERIPATLPRRRDAGARLTSRQRTLRRTGDALVAAGLMEIAGWSFTSPKFADRLMLDGNDPLRDAVVIENPMSEEESLLRTTLVGSLLDAAAVNRARGAEAIRLFEIGRVYHPSAEGLADEPLRVGGVLIGPSRRPGWRDADPPECDVHAAIATISALMASLGCDASTVAFDEPPPFLAPGRAASVVVNGGGIGFAGELHPQVADGFGLGRTAIFELDFESIASASSMTPSYSPISTHPAVKQDLAVVVAREVPAGVLVESALHVGGDLLESVEVFDVYEGDQVPEGFKSVGLRLSFRAGDRTLTEDEASGIRQAILGALESDHGAQSRA